MERLTKEKIKSLIAKRFENDRFFSLKDLPHPHSFKDMQTGANLVRDYILAHQKILVVGDYDVDGTLASVIMMKFFKMIGYDNVEYYIPNRFKDGYGVSVDIIKNHPSDLVITVDNGISAIEVGEYCLENQRKLIITDHHALQDNVPRADALINPQQNDCNFAQKGICGAAVAWYFCNAIKIALEKDFSLLGLLKYVAIATIADMMPLVEINKIFVKKGLEIFEKSNDLQDDLLKALLKGKITAQDVSFYITPLLNSAGRIDDARIVCEFFLAEDREEIKEKFVRLEQTNKMRKELANHASLELEQCVLENEFCALAYHNEWNEGILGILAAKLVQIKNKPSFVFSAKNGVLKGSGRSDGKVDIFQTLLPYSEKFIHFGGHAEAVGITIDLNFVQDFLAIFKGDCKLIGPRASEVLGELQLVDVDRELLKIIESFEPYGQGNPVPQFLVKEARIYESKVLKNLHQRFQLENRVSAIEFFSDKFYDKEDRIDFYCSLQEGAYNKHPTLLIKKILCHL